MSGADVDELVRIADRLCEIGQRMLYQFPSNRVHSFDLKALSSDLHIVISNIERDQEPQKKC